MIRRYIEEQLGPIAVSITAADGQQRPAAFSIETIFDQPCDGARTCVTVGLSDVPLRRAGGGLDRLEILFCAYDEFINDEILEWLFSIGERLLESQESAHLGMVWPLERSIVKQSALDCGCFYQPVYFPETMHGIDAMDPPLIFSWLIPITSKEAAFIDTSGIKKFDALFAKHDPDLLDLRRKSLV